MEIAKDSMPTCTRSLLRFVLFLVPPALQASSLFTYDHIVVVMEENKGYSQIIGNASAPYINALAAGGALFTNSFGITHPSQPNYLEFFSGSNQGVTTNTTPSGTFSTANLGSQLLAAGYTFNGYSESLPSSSFNGDNAGGADGYWRKHNPWINFSNVPQASNHPFTDFPSDFSTLATVSIVVPNQGNDMHNGTPATGDSWLAGNLGAYATWALSNNSLLIVTFDEDDGSEGNRIVTIFYGAGIVPGTYSQLITHHNVLRTIEDLYGLPYAGGAASASPITSVFAETPEPGSALLITVGLFGMVAIRHRSRVSSKS